MMDIVERIRNRTHDAPMAIEFLLDDAAEEIERLRGLLTYAVAKLEDVWDDGPPGEGWQSSELSAWVNKCRAALSPNQNGG